ncbi:MAG: GNAT family protein [Myxococcota bacterium]
MVPPPSHGPTLRTSRLVLRPFQPRDVETVAAYVSDPEWLRYLAPDFPDAERLVEAGMRIDWTRECAFAIELTGDLVGSVHLGYENPNPVGELACLVRPANWRKGLAVEACEATIRYGFDHLGLEKVFARADVRNAASVRGMEKLGMRNEGRLRKHRLSRDGTRVDEVVYGLLRSEWHAGSA